MSQINPTSGAGSTSGATSTLSGSQGSAMLDKDAFLKLMMVQLQHQDPLNPSDPTQYLSELASFTTLEQETNIATSTAQAAAEQHTVAAVALIGHTVTYTDSTGASVTGLVQSVQFTSIGPTLTVNGIAGIDPGTIDEVS